MRQQPDGKPKKKRKLCSRAPAGHRKRDLNQSKSKQGGKLQGTKHVSAADETLTEQLFAQLDDSEPEDNVVVEAVTDDFETFC
jgi:hypothetical protein